ncbi:MAG: hypothetical protein PHH24_04395 [Candidatus Moranbacteria bacterium]|jgi:hypothetical protein|nr:hypothetical protein [Candidatus Moranbacteria bacterium]MDD5652249.1 hypothetical protein [Candidatus Moranbacteria bacterium]MDX9856048.1 hypothetical protein [Candidatus Moranbacteria bacterium]
MSEELANKIRLNEARRESARNVLSRADANRSKKSLYGEKKESEEAKKQMPPFAGMKNPVAIAKKAKDMATAPLEFQPTDIAIYGAAFSLAGLKDLLDLAGLGSLPAIGTVVTFCFSIAIGLLLMFDGVSMSQARVARRMTRRYLTLIAGTMIEGFLFGLNFFPFELATVALIYWMSLVDRKREQRIE